MKTLAKYNMVARLRWAGAHNYNMKFVICTNDDSYAGYSLPEVSIDLSIV